MPNHITNNMVIVGTPENIRLFREMAFVEPGESFPDSGEINDQDIPVLCFDFVVTPPSNIEKGGCSGEHEEGVICWYTWNRENWGTKWGAYHHDHFNQRWLKGYGPEATITGRIDIRFDTAWNAPVPIFERIEQRWNVKVHAVSQDEGGFPDTIFGEPYDEEVIRKVVTFEFDSYETEVDEPTEVQA